jgi:CheY-like chemotaxis protein
MKEFNILLADDDQDDRYFFEKALKQISISTTLRTVEDGEQLMRFLEEHLTNLPDAIFLDLNMPKKTGGECLTEIKANEKLQNIPVVIYSTSLHEEIADGLYQSGAHYYLQKCNFSKLPKAITEVITLIQNDPERPSRTNFIMSNLVA